jgi:putative molybdopterin biosynthesis protein
VAPGEPLPPAAIYDTNGPIVAAAVTENGGRPVVFAAVPDDAAKLQAALENALATCDAIILSGGTSKGAGDLLPVSSGSWGRRALSSTAWLSNPASRFVSP